MTGMAAWRSGIGRDHLDDGQFHRGRPGLWVMTLRILVGPAGATGRKIRRRQSGERLRGEIHCCTAARWWQLSTLSQHGRLTRLVAALNPGHTRIPEDFGESRLKNERLPAA